VCGSLRTKDTSCGLKTQDLYCGYKGRVFPNMSSPSNRFQWVQGNLFSCTGLPTLILTNRSFIADIIRTKIRGQARSAMASFYCGSSKSQGSYTSTVNIIGSLIKTLSSPCLANGDQTFCKNLKSRLDENPQNISNLRSLFIWISTFFDEIYIVADGVDECDDRAVLYGLLVELKLKITNIKILISSRPELDTGMADALLKEPVIMIDRLVLSDIEIHLKFVIGDSTGAFARFTPDVKQQILDKLKACNGGMYIPA
jgi:hypothetical protein